MYVVFSSKKPFRSFSFNFFLEKKVPKIQAKNMLPPAFPGLGPHFWQPNPQPLVTNFVFK
jgi:hypothetical protein